MSDLGAHSDGEPRVETDGSGGLPLSSAQLGIWFAQKLNPDSPAYNIGEYLEVDGPLEPELFERALRDVVSAAEALRVRIIEQAGEPRQFVDGPRDDWSLPFIDVSSEADPRAAAEAWMRRDLGRPVEPTRGPLFGFALFRTSIDRFFWYARYHHIVMDAFGMALIARQVASAYALRCEASPSSIDRFGSLTDLVAEDAAYRSSERFARDREYWAERVADWPDEIGISRSQEPANQPEGFLRRTTSLEAANLDELRASRCERGRALPGFLRR